jgi:hypothetical protein
MKKIMLKIWEIGSTFNKPNHPPTMKKRDPRLSGFYNWLILHGYASPLTETCSSLTFHSSNHLLHTCDWFIMYFSGIKFNGMNEPVSYN